MQSVCNVKVKLVHAYVCKMYMIVCTLLMYSVCRVYAMLKVKLECACVCMCIIVCMLFTKKMVPLTSVQYSAPHPLPPLVGTSFHSFSVEQSNLAPTPSLMLIAAKLFWCMIYLRCLCTTPTSLFCCIYTPLRHRCKISR